MRCCGPLLDLSAWDALFEPYRGARTNPIPTYGNTGDKLIWKSMLAMLDRYDIRITPDEWDVLFWPGGGNMGSVYNACRAARATLLQSAEKRNIPFVILPQSWSSAEPIPYENTRLTARERPSAKLAGAELFPDLALGLSASFIAPTARRESGHFFRKDVEALVAKASASHDPVRHAGSVDSYLRLAASYDKIHTDRLHFAIAGLMVGADVTLYPNNYHKNRAVWEYSLRDLGCKFKTTIS
jgi:exopolysaccharide biosynthesis predicted pyruvyltransferase EpsI